LISTTPMTSFRYGDKVATVCSVTHRNHQGVSDPCINERTILASEVNAWIADAKRNPNATAFVLRSKVWRGF
jgi:hypothetical protein